MPGAEDKGTEGRRGGCREGSEEDVKGTAAGAKRKSKDAGAATVPGMLAPVPYCESYEFHIYQHILDCINVHSSLHY